MYIHTARQNHAHCLEDILLVCYSTSLYGHPHRLMLHIYIDTYIHKSYACIQCGKITHIVSKARCWDVISCPYTGTRLGLWTYGHVHLMMITWSRYIRGTAVGVACLCQIVRYVCVCVCMYVYIYIYIYICLYIYIYI